MLSAYADDMQQYAIKPISMSSFTAACQHMADMVDEGVPDGTADNEESAMRLYWVPFCTELGTSWERPEYAYLNPKQKVAEDKLKAMFLPWCH